MVSAHRLAETAAAGRRAKGAARERDAARARLAEAEAKLGRGPAPLADGEAFEARALDPDGACVVCLEAPRNVALLDCGHVVVCVGCADKIGDACPLCRRAVHEYRRVFLS